MASRTKTGDRSDSADAVPKRKGDPIHGTRDPAAAGSTTEGRSRKKAPASDRKQLGKYEIQNLIGAGGMGAVYLARDTELNRTVALKVLPREKADNPLLVKRFKSEAQSAATLQDPHIVTIYEAGEADGYLFIALEYVQGTDVQKLIEKREVIPVKRSVDIIKQVTKALVHLHKMNIVHRDIKPSNLLITREGVVKLTDLGLARSIDDTTTTGITRDGTTVGTVDYMAPEQARDSKAADIRSDLYSLGCTWYHMLTGRPPFIEGSVTNKLQAHGSQPLPDPRDRNESVPDGVVAAMQRMAAKSPDDRYQTPSDLLEDLENPNLTRTVVAEDAIASLSDEGEGRSRPRRPKPSSGGALPPKARKKHRDGDDDDKVGFSLDPLKIGLVVAGIAVVVGGIWFISTSLSKALTTKSFSLNPAAGSKGAEAEGADAAASEPARVVRPTSRKKDGEADPDDPDSGDGKTFVRRAGSQVIPKQEHEPIVRRGLPDDAPPVNLGRESERKLIPRWVGGLTLPGSVESSPSAKGLTVLDVGGGSGMHADLKTALEKAPDDGAVVRLHGSGPFPVPPSAIDGLDRIVIVSGGPERPLLLLNPSPSQPGLSISNGSLELVGVDAAFLGNRSPGPANLTLIDVRAGDLSVRDCSITLAGSRAGRTTAIQIGAPPDGRPADEYRPQVLLDRVFLRGADLEAIAIDGVGVDMAAVNSAFATGDAAVAVVRHAVEPTSSDEADSKPAKPPRVIVAGEGKKVPAARELRFFSCTATSTLNAFTFASPPESDAAPPATSVVVMNSLFAAEAGGEQPTLVKLTDWPRETESGDDRSVYRNLKFSIGSSAFTGWSRLVANALGPDSANSGKTVATADEWTAAWRLPARPEQFPSDAWPQSPIHDFAALAPGRLDAGTANVRAVLPTEGDVLGASAGDLHAPDDDLLVRAAAYAERPQLSGRLVPVNETARPIEVDLSKQDLGRVVAQGGWADGARFIATGSGIREVTPVVIKGKSLSIEFRQGDGRPLVVQPKSPALKSVLSGTEAPEAMFDVTGGNIQLRGGAFKIPALKSLAVPHWVLKVTDGSFAMTDCQVLGPVIELPRYRGAVAWNQTAGGVSPSPAAGRYAQTGRFENCFVIGRGACVETDGVVGRALVFKNTVAASAGDLLIFRISEKTTPENDDLHSAVEIVDCTFSATGPIFRIDGGASSRIDGQAGGNSRPLVFFVDRTVVAPPVDFGERETVPAVFSASAALIANRRVQWWGDTNGYSDRIKRFLVNPDSGDAAPLDSAMWKSTWGRHNVKNALTDRGDVALAADYPDRTKLTPGDFKLLETSKAGKAGPGGTPIGADVSLVKSSEKTEKTDDGLKRRTFGQPQPKKPKTPGF